MIGIRADANDKIASGHIMRCIAIAEQIEETFEQVVFITADRFPNGLLDERGYNHICLNSDWNDKISELETLKECLIEQNISALIVDSYEVNKEYLEALHKIVKVIYIDDIYMFEYPVDIVINYAIKVKKLFYDNYNINSVQFLLGPQYTPLRKEFQSNRIDINREVKNILITTGASDSHHLIRSLVNKINSMSAFSDICFHIIVGGFFSYEDIAALDTICMYSNNIILYKKVRSMVKVMMKCDLAVSAAGTTLAELCACGIPTICFAIADNQLEGVEAYDKEDIMASIGDIRNDLKAGIDSIINKILLLKNSQEIRQRYSEKGRRFIDGNGAKRIVDQIFSL